MMSVSFTGLLVILTISTYTTMAVVVSCPVSCQCEGETFFKCSGLQGFPEGDLSGVTHLRITESTIPVLTVDDLQQLPAVEILELGFNNINSIEPLAFDGLQALYYVSLEGNSIETIGNNTFVDLRLKRLFVSDNVNLVNIDISAFVNTTVEHLYASNCGLADDSLANVINSLGGVLEELDLSFHAAGMNWTYDGPLFFGLHIRALVLRNNGITDLDFLSESRLDLLDVSGNPLGEKAWDVLGYVDNLVEFAAENIGLQRLHPPISSSQLLVLNVGYNNISFFNAELLKDFRNLQTIVLKGNAISTLPADLGTYLPHLVVIDVSDNVIVSMDPVALSPLSLFVLEMANNRMYTLPIGFKDIFSEIVNINAAGNPFHCNCELRWLSEWLWNLPNSRRSVNIGECSSPDRNSGKPLRTLRSSDFLCQKPIILFVAETDFEIGEKISFECKTNGDPRPDLQILFNDSIVAKAPDVLTPDTEVTLVYTIEHFTCADIGNYTCTAINLVDFSEETLYLGGNLIENCTNIPITTTAEPSADKEEDSNIALIIPLVVCLSILVIFTLCIVVFLWKRKSRMNYNVRAHQRATGHVNTISYPDGHRFVVGATLRRYPEPYNPGWSTNGHSSVSTADNRSRRKNGEQRSAVRHSPV